MGRRARAVVVHSQPATDIDVRNVDTRLPELRVVARDLLQRALDEADIGDLTADVEVNELQHLEAPDRPKPVDELHELRRVESELRLLATTLRPAPRTLGDELDADPRDRHDAEVVGGLQQDVELAQLLEHNEHLVTELLAHEGEAHELLVLVAVADDHVIGGLRQGEHGLQFRLRPALETDAVRVTELEDLLDHVSLLIDLDRVYRRVAPLVLELLDRGLESIAERLDARPEDVREPHQHRKRHSLLLQVAREVEQVERTLRAIAIRPDDDVAALVDVEVAGAPAVDVVEVACRVDRPAGCVAL